MTKVNIHIDNFKIEENQIIAYAIVNGKDIDFYIAKEEFELFCDNNELREYERHYAGDEIGLDRDVVCQYSWPEIYDSYAILEKWLQFYIQALYEAEELDIETPIKKIISSRSKIA